MRIHHIALYAKDLERLRTFYETYFGAVSSAQYHNPRTGLTTYFLSFADGAKLELMHRPDVSAAVEGLRYGFIHIALSVGDAAVVDALTERLRTDGYTISSNPRTTGDGYYESCVLDPEGNQIEITI